MNQILWRNKITTLLIVLLPMLGAYQSPIKAIGAGEFALLIASFISLPMLLKNQKVRVYKYYYFIFYAIFISFFMVLKYNSYNLGDITKRLIVMLYYTFLIFGFGNRFFDVDYGLIIYKKLTLLSAGFIYLQSMIYYFSNRIILGIIPGLTLNYSISSYSGLYEKYVSMASILYRPSSFFLEPSYYAQYVAPCLLLILFTKHTKRTYFEAIFITVSMLLSTSANALVFAGFIWLIYFVLYSSHTDGVVRMIKIISISVLLITILSFVVLKVPKLFSVIERFNTIGNGGIGSANVRTMKGFLFFREIDFLEKFFGIGMGSYYSYIRVNPINIIDVNDEYMNSIGYLLTSTGILGFSLFLVSLKDVVKSHVRSANVLLLLLLIYCISSSVFSSPVYTLMLIFMLKLTTEKDEF